MTQVRKAGKLGAGGAERRFRSFLGGWTLHTSAWGATVLPELARDRRLRRARPDVAAAIAAVTEQAGLAEVDVNPAVTWYTGQIVTVVSGRSTGPTRQDVEADAEKAAAVVRDTFPVPVGDPVLVRIRAPGRWLERWL